VEETNEEFILRNFFRMRQGELHDQQSKREIQEVEHEKLEEELQVLNEKLSSKAIFSEGENGGDASKSRVDSQLEY